MHDIYELLEAVRAGENFKDSENFIEDGMLDSFDIIALIELIEEKCNVLIDGMDILPENFVSVEKIQSLIENAQKA